MLRKTRYIKGLNLHLTYVEGLLRYLYYLQLIFFICLHLTYERNYYEYLSPQ